MANTEVGSAYVSIYPNTSGFSDNIAGSLGTSIGKLALGTMVGNLLSKGVGAIAGSMDNAISRLDTLNNFPRLMESIGYNAGDAEKQIKNIMDSLVGLPATTQDVVALTQSFADSTGSLELAANGALALTDAMIAAGVSTQDQVQLQRIFDRAIGSGTVTSQQWLAIQGRIPAATTQAAKMLLGEAASSEQLGEAIQNGDVSMQDFLATMVELDQNGNGTFSSLNEQAHIAAGGVGNAMLIMGQTVSNQMANIMDEIGQENIAAPFQAASDTMKIVGGDIVTGIAWVKDSLGDRLSTISGHFDGLKDAVGRVAGGAWNTIKDVAAQLTPILLDLADGAIQTLTDALNGAEPFLSSFADGVSNAFQFLIDHGDAVGAIATGIFTAFMLYKGLMFVSGVLGSIYSAFTTLWAGIMANPLLALIGIIAAVVAGLVYWFTQTEEGRAEWEKFTTGLQELWESIKVAAKQLWDNITQAWDGIKTNVSNAVDALKTTLINVWNSIKITVTNVMNGIKTTLVDIWNGIKTTVSNVVNGVKTAVTNAWNGIKTVTSSVFNGIKSTISGIWDGVKNTISNAINGAKDAVKNAIDKIKGFFNFQFTWPHIKLPHFSISGSINPLDWLEKGVPKISVSWYATGGITDGITLLGAGEKGPEAIMPLEGRYMQPFAAATARYMSDDDKYDRDTYELLARYAPAILDAIPNLSQRDFDRMARKAVLA